MQRPQDCVCCCPFIRTWLAFDPFLPWEGLRASLNLHKSRQDYFEIETAMMAISGSDLGWRCSRLLPSEPQGVFYAQQGGRRLRCSLLAYMLPVERCTFPYVVGGPLHMISIGCPRHPCSPVSCGSNVILRQYADMGVSLHYSTRVQAVLAEQAAGLTMCAQIYSEDSSGVPSWESA